MKVLVCGDRNWSDLVAIHRELVKLPKDTVIIQGVAHGADKLAYNVACELGLYVLGVEAEWERYGRAAGPIRNKKMLDMGPELVLVLAFHSDIANSRGTANMVKISRKAGVEVRVVER